MACFDVASKSYALAYMFAGFSTIVVALKVVDGTSLLLGHPHSLASLQPDLFVYDSVPFVTFRGFRT